jgi:PAS domain S-box-containing protein
MKVNLQLDLATVTVRYQKLLERIPYMAWLMTEQGEIVTFNQLWHQYLGRTSGDALVDPIYGTFIEILHEEERDRFLEQWNKAKKFQKSLEIKLQLQSPLGDWEWFEVELEPNCDELGQIIWIGTAIRLGGNAAISGQQQSVQFLEALLSHASDGIVACNAEGELVLFNRMAQIFHGLPPEPIDSEEWANYYDLYDRDGLKVLTKSEIPLFRALQGEAVVGQEMMIKSRAGGDRSLLATGSAIYSPTGEQLGAVALMRDVTDYRQAMMALQQSEQKFRAIFDGVFQFIGLIDPDGTLLEANLTALRFGGMKAEEAIGRRLWEVSGWKFSPAAQQQLQDSIIRAAQGEFIRYEMELMGAENRLATLDFSLMPIRNDHGDVTLIIPEGRDISQLKQAEVDRTSAEHYSERLSIALQVAKAGAWNWNLVNQKIFWTREFEILFDYEPGTTQKTYNEWLQRVHPNDRQRAETALQDAIDQVLPEYRCEYRIVHLDGQIRWIDAIGELHSDEQGNPQLSGLVYDITERKRYEEALYLSEEFTRRILASSKDCIKVLDLDGRLLYMNDGGQALMEIDDFSTVAHNPWLEFWQGSETTAASSALATAKAGGVGKFEGYGVTAKGTSKWWEVVVTSILNANSHVEQILSVSRDITDRKQTTLAIQASEELFRHTFEHTPVGFAHVKLDGSLERVNQKFSEIVGYSKEELLATTFQEITEPADLAADLTLLEQLLNGEVKEYTLEKRYIHKQGQHVWVSLTTSLVRELAIDGQIGAPQYFMAAIKDITERKQLEAINQTQTTDLLRLNNSLMLTQQRLEERNQELDSFVYTVSHDLKAPLRSISNLSEWIEDDLDGQMSEDNQKQFQLLRQRVQRMNYLIDGLLRYSRVGRQELLSETVDVAQLLSETIDSLDPPASFKIEIVSPLPTLNTKKILLDQIFANLLSNAIKHHHRATGQIKITAEDKGDLYQFSIADDGPGIPTGASQKRIFEIFQTLQSNVSSENTGIGLALVKKIVEGEGGQIWLDEEVVSGAKFCFTWPKIDK